ncbi:MAG: DUF5716 family protein [Eubacteriales bacterium]|nr:DUF5716 family protein [Eubacteriales bacterium]
MNEIRDLIIGIDFGKEYSQICYYDRKAGEPRSLSMKVGASQYEAPTCICRRVEQGDYCVGLEAEYFAREKGGYMIGSLYDVCEKDETVQIQGEMVEPWELLANFLKGLLKFLGVMDVVKNTKCLVVSAPSLNQVQVSNFQKACEYLGFPEEKYMLMDYGECFYYYALTQKRETWNRSVAWYAFTPESVSFRKLTLNGASRPILARLDEPVDTELSEEGEIRDLEFCKFIQSTLGTELFSSIQITGKGFDQQWAQQSVKALCYQKRKVFYGNNLFAKGACAAGKDRLEDKNLKGYRYMSDSLVLSDVGMDMRVMGSPTYYPLIEAGNNWYECKAYCEFILDDTQELVFVVSTFGEQEKKRVAMQLPGLPKRPNKTTRLSLDLQYVSRKECRITVKDLGFGEMYPGSGKIWKESVQW